MHPLDQTFAALGDATRRAILARLAEGETSLSDVAAPFEMSQTAVSKHVHVLERAGLVRVSKRGRTRYCELQAAPMKAAAEWLDAYQRYWESQLDALGKFLEDNP